MATSPPTRTRAKQSPRPDILRPGQPARASIAEGDLCRHCTGKCCRYFTVPIETPVTWDDYDAARWYLAHGRTLLYVEKGDWFLVVLARCRYLAADLRCRIYHDRPKICREYTVAECEYDSDWEFEKVFESPEQLWEYAEAVLPPRRRPRTQPAAPAVPGLVVISPPGIP